MYLASTNYYTPPDAQNVVKSATYPWTNAQISSGLQLGPLCKPCDDGHALSLACYKCLMILLYACTYSFQYFLQRPLYFYQAKEMVQYLGFNFVKGIYCGFYTNNVTTDNSFSKHGRNHTIIDTTDYF